jgi:hypothetical protein
MRRQLFLAGALIGVAACSGASAESEAALDGGEKEDTGSGGHLLPVEGGVLLIDSGASPQGYGNAYAEAATGSSDAGAEAPTHPHDDGGWVAAVPSGMPQVIAGGGPILQSPVLQSVTFSNYDNTTAVDDFVQKLGQSDYWQSVVAQYGVGRASAVASVHLSYPGPRNVDDTQIQSWLTTEIQTDPAVMQPAAGALYVAFFPSGTSITFNGMQSCFTMGAYHNSFVLNGASISYAVIPECSQEGRSLLDTTTSAASHEIVESVTDPLPLTTTTAFGGVDPDHLYLQVVMGGGEVGDLCAPWPSSFFVPSNPPYMVQRSWSNRAVVAGHDPCQPALPGEVFFNAVPVLADDVHITNLGQVYATKGASIAVGATRTIDVHLYSDDDVGTWTVGAQNIPVSASNLAFTWDRTTGQNGDTLHLTIHVGGVNPNYGGDPFIVSSTQGSTTNYWVGYVGQ